MSRKHYKAIAKLISHRYWHDAMGEQEKLLVRSIAEDLAVEFKKDNPEFDRAKFLNACFSQD